MLRRLVLLCAVLVHCGASKHSSSSAGDGGAPVDASSGDAASCDKCDGTSGACAPLPVCSAANPCKGDPLVGEPSQITDAITPPTCKTSATSGHPAFDDGPPLAYTDSLGQARAACVFKPQGASASSPRPLVFFVHGGHGSADSMYDRTLLRQKAASYDLTGDAARPGFVLVADQGRNLTWPNQDGSGSHHDVYYRHVDPNDAAENPDVWSFDHLIDTLAQDGSIDTKRVYVMGWSNGAFFAQLYGLARKGTPTPGGHRVAGVVAFDGGDPFENETDGQTPSCKASAYPASAMPIYAIHRACSIVGCDAAQRTSLGMPPGYDVEDWLATMKALPGGDAVTDVMIDGSSAQVTSCATTCARADALLNHVRWPDGIADKSNHDWEPQMLDFLKAHALP